MVDVADELRPSRLHRRCYRCDAPLIESAIDACPRCDSRPRERQSLRRFRLRSALIAIAVLAFVWGFVLAEWRHQHAARGPTDPWELIAPPAGRPTDAAGTGP